ncbi:SDR family NAD(P)-dependent oxidoreductase [Solihabitans fulvus]|uniref:SDR family NAD(P)-dependent oxidoreductase n=1 Tax=Solihabitans fulvus TaxID=1892852 RepID=A0A5B2X6G0_9PSEU|nr:oxidoreductase [Solihabitans fulvus]KAA2258522.1 SDR family NAD(P)-dependent oxidoreductase [Solihabitans fulvus]
MTKQTATDVGDQRGRTVVITGANTGIGFEVAKAMASRGATVVLACRDVEKAERVATAMDGSILVCRLDLASMTSVRQAVEWIRGTLPRLDLLVNNAGVMMTPFGATEDGFELQFGINHLGHFAFTGLLLDRLSESPDSRIVTVTSSANRNGAVDLDDPHFRRRRYRPIDAYAQSKLANVMFSQELHRRLAAAGSRTIAVAVEPGMTPTELTRHLTGPIRLATTMITRLFGQPDAIAGARIVLRAATDPDARGGDYYAPNGRPPMRFSGLPTRIEPLTTDAQARQRLWAESERMTGVTYSALKGSAR